MPDPTTTISIDGIHAFAGIVIDTYNCGEVPDDLDSVAFFGLAMEAIQEATGLGTTDALDNFAVNHLHLGQS